MNFDVNRLLPSAQLQLLQAHTSWRNQDATVTLPWPLIGRGWSHYQNTDLWLVESKKKIEAIEALKLNENKETMKKGRRDLIDKGNCWGILKIKLLSMEFSDDDFITNQI